MIIFETRKFKYYATDLFEPEKFIEIPECIFNNTVIEHRDLFEMHYQNGSTRIFINKNNQMDKYKVVTI